MRCILFLRGWQPCGSNSIADRQQLEQVLRGAGFMKPAIWLYSGNLLLSSPLPRPELEWQVRELLFRHFGTDLAVISQSGRQVAAAAENPFAEELLNHQGWVYALVTNDHLDRNKLAALSQADLGGEKFALGSAALYYYRPLFAENPTLSSDYFERQLGIVATSRKLSLMRRLARLWAPVCED